MPRVRTKPNQAHNQADCTMECCKGHCDSRIAAGRAWTFFTTRGFVATVVKGILVVNGVNGVNVNEAGMVGRMRMIPTSTTMTKHVCSLDLEKKHPIWVPIPTKAKCTAVEYGCAHHVVRLEKGNVIIDWSIPHQSLPSTLFL
jgi:hypothetical protein